MTELTGRGEGWTEERVERGASDRAMAEAAAPGRSGSQGESTA